MDNRTQLRERWEAVTRWPLIGVSVAFLVAYSIFVLAPAEPGDSRPILLVVLVICWAAFVIDIVVRAVVLTRRGARASYLRHHRIDLASALFPPARPFQLLKYLRAAPGFRGRGGNALRSRMVTTAVCYAVVFVYVIALTALQVERPAPNATIVTFGEAIWWACVTLATVGYGDYAPVTALGRVLAVVLMAGGVAIIGVSSAVVVTYVSERIASTKRSVAGSPADGRSDSERADEHPPLETGNP
jgi:voltage-gated potassium channel